MKNTNIILLNENQNINELYLNNSFENQNQNLLLQDKNDFVFPFNSNFYLSQKTNEKLTIEEFKKIMNDYPKAETTKSEITDDESSEFIYCVKKSKNVKYELQSTSNASKNISFTQEKNYMDINIKDNYVTNTKIINFKTVLHHKRGRKSIKNEKRNKYLNKYHGSSDFDNVQRKIQVNYITFLVKLANDALKTVLGRNIFLKM